MQEEFYKGISVAGLNAGLFPDVAVYIKTGSNYMLYKPHGQKMTDADHERLERRGAEYIYVRTGDMEIVSEYLENNLGQVLKSADLKSSQKGRIVYQTVVDYVAEIFEDSEKIKNVDRCRNLVRQIGRYLCSEKDALEPLKGAVQGAPYPVAHSVQVAVLALLMHIKILQMGEGKALEDAGIGALFCDIGMVDGVSDPGNQAKASSLQEYHQIKQHVTMGHDYLKRLGLFSDAVLSVVLCHHERFDGKGYPSRLAGDAIPKSAQIVALCDKFCTLTSDHSHRVAVTPLQAVQNMKDSKGACESILFEQFHKIIIGCRL